MATDKEGEKIKRELLVKCIFKSSNILRSRKLSSPIQNRPFSIGLKIKNIDSKDFPGARVSKLNIRSSENKDLTEPFEEEFSIPNINPNDEFEIMVPNAISTCLSGLVWISCDITPKKENEKILTYQEDINTGRISKYDTNKWGNGYYILGKYEYEQSKTNNLIFLLTILTLLHGVFGLRNIALWLIQLIANFFLLLGNLLGTIVK